MLCTDILEPLYYFFSADAPPLLYYSHIPASIAAVLLSLFVYRRDRQSLPAKVFFAMTIFFFLWSLTDIALWANIDGRIILFLWSFINLFEAATSVLMLYFVYVFLEKKDVTTRFKLVGAGLLLPLIIFMPTHLNIVGFDIENCEAIQGPLIYYFYFVEALVSMWTIGYLIRKYRQASLIEKKRVGLLTMAVTCFMLFYSGTNIAGSLTQAWEILMYGFFGVPIFLGLLVWMMVYYHAFNVKLLSTQALVMGLTLMVGSQLFFTYDFIGLILVLVTLVLVVVMGIFLIREVRKEVERKEELEILSKELTAANTELKRLDAAKSEFISIASHQLRTPLTAIRGFIDLLLEGAYGKVEPKIGETLNKVLIANNRLMGLVENLLNVSRIEAGRIRYQFAPTHIEAIVDELDDMFLLAAKEKGVTFAVNRPAKPLPLLTLDAAKIREVLSNLIDNSLKYTPTGGSVTVSFEKHQDCVAVIVADTGMGIDPKDLPHLFKKFERGSQAERVNVSSTGLGLYVGRKFAEAHGGTITAESGGKGKGARFVLELPIPASGRVK